MDYEIKAVQEIYQGRVFRVQVMQVKMADGREVRFDLVKHPGAVAIIPVDAEGRILLLNQFRIGVGQTLLEIPAGTLEAGEDPIVCADRELREETGMAAHSLIKLGEFFLAPGYSSERLHIFLARDLYPSPLEADADEFLQLQPIPIEQAYRMAKAGEFHDAKTLAGLMLAMPYLLPVNPV